MAENMMIYNSDSAVNIDPQLKMTMDLFNDMTKGIEGIFHNMLQDKPSQRMVYRSANQAKEEAKIPDALWEQMEPELECIPLWNEDGSIKKKYYTVKGISDWLKNHSYQSNDPIFKNMY